MIRILMQGLPLMTQKKLAFCSLVFDCSTCQPTFKFCSFASWAIKNEGINVIAEISAELQRERKKNAELLERIAALEAQMHEREKNSLLTNGHCGCPNSTARSFKRFKRQRIEPTGYKIPDVGSNGNIEMGLQMKHDIDETRCLLPEDASFEGHQLVNWMSMDETQILNFEKLKDGEAAADFDDTDDTNDKDDEYCEEDDIDIDHGDKENDKNLKASYELKKHHEGARMQINMPYMGMPSANLSEAPFSNVNNETKHDSNKDLLPPVARSIHEKKELKRHDKRETKIIGGCRTSSEILASGPGASHKGSGGLSMRRKPPKVAFCPKEVKRIIDSEALLLKKAQSHTIRKIIVFASLGIRHGCEDLYELDFNHFSILRKGEPYVSPENPGEHVLYENHGVRRKIFCTNRQNPTLCPVQILEEEKAMRPSDASCPSCLFLCIKYGGRTRNLPQNELIHNILC
ncbi:uncharacterized protein LOC131152806 isoform X2 [Malania oleifera]|uniref:uncharacterized protein LOC131152806 isoform X2 n=1 Tax=Malania oleifera TaxID=397392 RepID=UPI0025ADDBB0|nr:uncharacterized protein LOC131152806 isoform X2 [Malania oleifera]